MATPTLSELKDFFREHYLAGEVSLQEIVDGKPVAVSTGWFGEPGNVDHLITVTVERVEAKKEHG